MVLPNERTNGFALEAKSEALSEEILPPAVLQKMQNPGSANGPPMVDGWMVRPSSG